MRLEELSIIQLLLEGLQATFSGPILVFIPAYVAFLLASLGREKVYEKSGYEQWRDVSVTVFSFSAFFAAMFLILAMLHTPAMQQVYGTALTSLHVGAGISVLLWSGWLFTKVKNVRQTILNIGEWPQASIGAVMVGGAFGASVEIEMPYLLSVLNMVTEAEMLSHAGGLLFFYMCGLALGVSVLGFVIWLLLRSFTGDNAILAGAGFLVISALMVGTDFYATLGDSLTDVVFSLGQLG